MKTRATMAPTAIASLCRVQLRACSPVCISTSWWASGPGRSGPLRDVRWKRACLGFGAENRSGGGQTVGWSTSEKSARQRPSAKDTTPIRGEVEILWRVASTARRGRTRVTGLARAALVVFAHLRRAAWKDRVASFSPLNGVVGLGRHWRSKRHEPSGWALHESLV